MRYILTKVTMPGYRCYTCGFEDVLPRGRKVPPSTCPGCNPKPTKRGKYVILRLTEGGYSCYQCGHYGERGNTAPNACDGCGKVVRYCYTQNGVKIPRGQKTGGVVIAQPLGAFVQYDPANQEHAAVKARDLERVAAGTMSPLAFKEYWGEKPG